MFVNPIINPWKDCWEKKHFLLFPTKFFTLWKADFIIWATSILLSANFFKSVQSKMLFGRFQLHESFLTHMTKFQPCTNSMHLQRTYMYSIFNLIFFSFFFKGDENIVGENTSYLHFRFTSCYRSFIPFYYIASSCLTLYHTIPTFNHPWIEAFWKHCGKRRKCW